MTEAGRRVQLRIEEVSAGVLEEISTISIRYRVGSVLHVRLNDAGLTGVSLVERPLASPYEKDYDTFAGEGPLRWASRFDVGNWGLISAWSEGRRVGSAVIAWDTPEVWMLEGRTDLACLWDLRVAPERRGMGIGRSLFHQVEQWAAERDCQQLKVETQNTNVPACRFYVRQGCRLGGINLHAYPELPNEVQLLWYKQLSRR
jgi:ribosomal protein S18 acetylase RimI-like enzyme